MAMTRQMWTMSCVAGRAALALVLWAGLPVGRHAQPAASTAPPADAPQDPAVTADVVHWEWDFS